MYKKLCIRKIRNENKQEKTEINNVERLDHFDQNDFSGISWIYL